MKARRRRLQRARKRERLLAYDERIEVRRAFTFLAQRRPANHVNRWCIECDGPPAPLPSLFRRWDVRDALSVEELAQLNAIEDAYRVAVRTGGWKCLPCQQRASRESARFKPGLLTSIALAD